MPGVHNTIEADVKGRAGLAYAFINSFLGYFGMPGPPSHRSL